jgi:hydrogenase-4 component B
VTAAGAGLAVAAAAAGLAIAAAVVLPRRDRAVVVGVLSAVPAASGLVSAAAVLTGSRRFVAAFPRLLPLGGVRLELDPLGAVFVVAAALVAIPASIYGIGYAREGLDNRPVQAVYPLFVWILR